MHWVENSEIFDKIIIIGGFFYKIACHQEFHFHYVYVFAFCSWIMVATPYKYEHYSVLEWVCLANKFEQQQKTTTTTWETTTRGRDYWGRRWN